MDKNLKKIFKIKLVEYHMGLVNSTQLWGDPLNHPDLTGQYLK